MKQLDSDISTRFQTLGRQDLQAILEFVKADMPPLQDADTILQKLRQRSRATLRQQ